MVLIIYWENKRFKLNNKNVKIQRTHMLCSIVIVCAAACSFAFIFDLPFWSIRDHLKDYQSIEWQRVSEERSKSLAAFASLRLEIDTNSIQVQYRWVQWINCLYDHPIRKRGIKDPPNTILEQSPESLPSNHVEDLTENNLIQ